MRTDGKTVAAAGLGMVLLVLVGVLGSGCAAGGLTKCTTDDDCTGADQCVDGVCQVTDAGSSGGPTGNGSATDGNGTGFDGGSGPGSGSGGDATAGRDGGDGWVPPDGNGGTGDAMTTSGGSDASDTGPMGCGGCGIGEKCVNGTCESACQPKCKASQQCARRGDGPKCYPTCKEAQSTKGCSRSGTRCIDIDSSQSNEVLICDDSDCSENPDCQSGTCISFVNDYGRCVGNGTKSVGDSCDTSSSSPECVKGAFCVTFGRNTMGTCRKLCDPWGAPSSCGSGSHCSLFTLQNNTYSTPSLRQGWCNPSVTTQGSSSLDQCSPADNMCGDAMRCVSGQTNYCMKWCRPGQNDCTGTVPPRYNASGVCNNYVFGGIREVGRCLPQCPSVGCPSGSRCVQGKCRQECSTKSDCCGGSSPCNWTCNANGLCE